MRQVLQDSSFQTVPEEEFLQPYGTLLLYIELLEAQLVGKPHWEQDKRQSDERGGSCPRRVHGGEKKKSNENENKIVGLVVEKRMI